MEKEVAANDWCARAFIEPALVADALLSLRDSARLRIPYRAVLDADDSPAAEWNLSTIVRPLPDATEYDGPSTSFAVIPAARLLSWAAQKRRSRIIKLAGIRQRRREEADAAAAPNWRKEGQLPDGKKRRASPQSPFESYYSSGSTSGGSGGEERLSLSGKNPKKPRVCSAVTATASFSVDAPATEVTVKQWAAASSGLEIAAPGTRRRPPPPTGKKMSKTGLQAVENSLREEKSRLQQEMEMRRRSVEEIRAENSKLKLELLKKSVAIKPGPLAQLEPPHQVAPSSSLAGREQVALLPDLNEPLPVWID